MIWAVVGFAIGGLLLSGFALGVEYALWTIRKAKR